MAEGCILNRLLSKFSIIAIVVILFSQIVTADAPKLTKFDSVLGYDNIEDVNSVYEFTESNENLKIDYLHNSKGIRDDKEYNYERNDKKRILLLGDSYFYGLANNQNETISYFLQQMLPNHEIINLAVLGYSNTQELLKLKAEGIKYKPDIVILGLYGNDFYQNILRDECKDKPCFRPSAQDPDEIVLVNSPVTISHGFSIIDLLQDSFQNVGNLFNPYSNDYDLHTEKYPEILEFEKYMLRKDPNKEGILLTTPKNVDAFRMTCKILNLFQQYSVENNFEFYVLVIPEHYQINRDILHKLKAVVQQYYDIDENSFEFDFRITNNQLQQCGAAYNINMIDIADDFQSAYDNGAVLYNKYRTNHWTPAATKIAAEKVAEVIK